MEKTTMTDSTIAFIGLGLIGGSIARAIRKTRPDIRIMAYMRSRSRLEQARKEGIVDVILEGIDENLRECDLIFLCTPVEYNAGYLSAIRPYLKQGALITDVGSTKCGIHEVIRRQGLEYCFVGGHPMALSLIHISLPIRFVTPVSSANASATVVLPAPPCPSNTTLRICSVPYTFINFPPVH